MMFNVPQFVDVEDKIAGPLTAKQLLWMIGMGAAILVAKLFLGGGAALYVAAVPIVIVFVLLAFYKPHGQPLILFVFHGIFFLFRPKVMMWRRPNSRALSRPSLPIREKRPVTESKTGEKRVTTDRIREVASMLDRQ
jgi:hypothetical protein